MVCFAGMIFLQAVAFLYRSYLERREGPDSEDKFLDRDILEPDEPALEEPDHLAHEGL